MPSGATLPQFQFSNVELGDMYHTRPMHRGNKSDEKDFDSLSEDSDQAGAAPRVPVPPGAAPLQPGAAGSSGDYPDKNNCVTMTHDLFGPPNTPQPMLPTEVLVEDECYKNRSLATFTLPHPLPTTVRPKNVSGT